MQAITLWQPWATLVALGLKKIETRSWSPYSNRPAGMPGQVDLAFRKNGLAIHAARRTPTDELRAAFQDRWIRMVLAMHGITESNWTGGAGSLPQGAIVAVSTLTAVIQTNPGGGLAGLTDMERAFGNYAPGRFAWLLADVINLNDAPVPAKGRQRIWPVPADLVEQLAERADAWQRLPPGGF